MSNSVKLWEGRKPECIRSKPIVYAECIRQNRGRIQNSPKQAQNSPKSTHFLNKVLTHLYVNVKACKDFRGAYLNSYDRQKENSTKSMGGCYSIQFCPIFRRLFQKNFFGKDFWWRPFIICPISILHSDAPSTLEKDRWISGRNTCQIMAVLQAACKCCIDFSGKASAKDK